MKNYFCGYGMLKNKQSKQESNSKDNYVAYLTLVYLALKLPQATLLSGDRVHSCDTSSLCQGTEEGIKDFLKAERHFRRGKEMLEGVCGGMFKN